MNKMIRKKLGSPRGETITETLAALLVITLAMTMLAGSIVSAAKINAKVADNDLSFRVSTESPASGTAKIVHGDTSDDSISVDIYTTEVGYVYYYEKTAAGG